MSFSPLSCDLTRADVLRALAGSAMGLLAHGCRWCADDAASRFAAAFRLLRSDVDGGLVTAGVLAADGCESAACGWRRFSRERIPITVDSLFDVASVTKPLVAAAAARLVAAGRLDPNAPFTEYLPEHCLGKSCEVTVADLATHASGFDNLDNYDDVRTVESSEAFFARFMQSRPERPRRRYFDYRCHNYILLGFVLEAVSGKRLDVACRELVFEPLGMRDTRWGPIANPVRVVEQSPAFVNTVNAPGVINDERARFVARPIGNAGVYATADDLLAFVSDLARRQRFEKAYYDLLLTPSFSAPSLVGGAWRMRSFGFDMTPDPSLTGYSARAVRHSGFTGQTVIADPDRAFAAVVLTSRNCDHRVGVCHRNRILSALV